MPTASDLENSLQQLKNPAKTTLLGRFFKTGPGQYAAGDKFLGVMVPDQRLVAKEFRELSLSELQKSIRSPFHEIRLTTLLILVDRYKKSGAIETGKIFRFYLKNRRYINNWDLVDLSAPQILGGHLFGRDRQILYRLADSKSLWDRRLAMLATAYFIRQGDYSDTLRLAEKYLTDEQDLIHKATGWLLREVGKRDQRKMTEFLDLHCTKMPRTMLRYAIEKLPERTRRQYLKKKL